MKRHNLKIKGFTLTKAKRTESAFTLMNRASERSERGFTLIEMLVVVSIIGILAALATVSFSSTQKQARDTQRKSDLKQYQNALEAYANKNNGLYPAYGTTDANATTNVCPNALLLSNCPADPDKVDGIYKYRSDGPFSGAPAATKYILWAKLENVSNTYWVVCSTGSSGKTTTEPLGSNGTCPTLTQ